MSSEALTSSELAENAAFIHVEQPNINIKNERQTSMPLDEMTILSGEEKPDINRDEDRNTNIRMSENTGLSVDEQAHVNGSGGPNEYNQPNQAKVIYRVEFVTPMGSVLREFETTGLHREEVSAPTAAVIEIVSTYETNHSVMTNNFQASATTVPVVSMRIFSGAIIHALRSIVKYYPGKDLSSDIVYIQSPYPILVHHYDELVEYRERFQPDSLSDCCYREKDAYEHIGLLLEFLDKHIMPAVREEQERNRRGFATFDMLWVLSKPGITVGGKLMADNDTYVGIRHSLTGGSFTTPSTPWLTKIWTLTYDGTFVNRVLRSLITTTWDGEQDISRDLIYDINVMPWHPELNKLVAQGKIYWSLLRKQCRYYTGKAECFPHNQIDGLVMIDMDSYYEQSPGKLPVTMTLVEDSRAWISDCTCRVCNNRRKNDMSSKTSGIWDDYEYLAPKTCDDLTDHQYLLLPKTISAYIFRTRTWEVVHVDGFSEPKFDEDLIENLVMDESRRGTLKALAKSFVRENTHGEKTERLPWSADFVKGKGAGLIFLLHGKPGVGKTCTAECIAAFTSRPLMILTSSDIGIEPKEVENNLTSLFKRAQSWGTVLLIDEADVFMERRTTSDFARNSLVAGFLRALEFYDGILFLTTNRVGSFDDAFISRIHVQLYYPDFDDESRRKVWKTFIEKLQRERGDYIRLNIDAKEYLDGKELKAVRWNGREIRNAFQTAVALAEFEAVKDQEGKIILTDKHLKAVVEMSRDFKDYLHDLHKGDEEKRAERRHERLDKSVMI